MTSDGGLRAARWAVMRGLMTTVGRTSKGIRLGYRHGFDSGMMLDYAYANQARGTLGVGRLIDRAFLNAAGWRAVRARGALLQRTLRAEIDRRPDRRPVVILDMAAGPGRYLQELVAGLPADRVRVTCRDLAVLGLAQGRAAARRRGLTNIAYERGDALDPKPPDEAPDVIVVAGLYELIPEDEAIRESLARLRGLLAPGGTLVFTTRTRRPRREFAGDVPPNRACRPVAVTENWAKQAGYVDIASVRETVGLFTVTTARA
jgi:SAM-dependent methyltransferase